MHSLPIRSLQRGRFGVLTAATILLAVGLAGPAGASAATATSLAFGVQPGGGAPGVAWAQQPVVRVVDSTGQTVTTSNAPVTLAIGSNPAAGTLTCTGGLTMAATNGIATFSGCSVDHLGAGYTLLATASGLSAATSSSFDISNSPPNTVDHLQWAIATANPPPLSGIAGGGFSFDFGVRVLDSNNTLVTAGPHATVPVTLSMSPNSAGAAVTCTGGLTVAAVGGIAHWTGCSVSASGNGLSFVATAPGFDPVTSPTFNILAGGASPALTISASRSAILWGDGVDITVHLTAPAGSAVSVANRTIHVQVARVHAATAFTTIAPGGDIVTDASGTAVITGYTPATNLWYQAVFDGSADLGPITSADTRVTVRQLALITPDNAGAIRTIKKGTIVNFRTTVRPARDDVPRTHVTWQVWRLVNNRWTLFLTQTSDPDVSGLAFLGVTFNTGRWYVRSQANPTQLNANSLWTANQYYDVK